MHSNHQPIPSSPQAGTYAGLENRFITADEAISAWKNLDGSLLSKPTVKDHFMKTNDHLWITLLSLPVNERGLSKGERLWMYGGMSLNDINQLFMKA